jgi:hypothetical protein
MCGKMNTAAPIEGATSTLNRCFLSAVIVIASLFSFACHATAAPPPNTALTYQQWFESMEQPGDHHLPCCSLADCHFATARATMVGFEVAIDNSWVVVPPDRILQRVSNPTGRAVVCYRHILDIENDHGDMIRIFCFVRPPDV